MTKGDRFYFYNNTYAVIDMYNTIVFLSTDKQECENKATELNNIEQKECKDYIYLDSYTVINIVPPLGTSILCEVICS